MGDTVWLLWFEQERDDGDDAELLIGVYRTEQAAKSAIDRLKSQPGFRDYLESFHVYENTLDKDDWTGGFTRV
jgi:homoserine kinase type II